MFFTNASNFCNLFNHISISQKKVSSVKIKHSKENVNITQILFDEGFIRGFYIDFDNTLKYKIIFILLKHFFNDHSFSYNLKINNFSGLNFKIVSSSLLKNNYTGFHFVILSTRKGILSGYRASKFKLGGKLLLEIY